MRINSTFTAKIPKFKYIFQNQNWENTKFTMHEIAFEDYHIHSLFASPTCSSHYTYKHKHFLSNAYSTLPLKKPFIRTKPCQVSGQEKRYSEGELFLSFSSNMSKIKKKLELASKFGFKISKLSSSSPVPDRYYFISDIDVGKHCIVNVLRKTQFLAVACIFCWQNDYFTPKNLDQS